MVRANEFWVFVPIHGGKLCVDIQDKALVMDNDPFGGDLVSKSPESFLTFPQRFFCPLALGDVYDADDCMTNRQAHRPQCHFNGECAAVLSGIRGLSNVNCSPARILPQNPCFPVWIVLGSRSLMDLESSSSLA